MATVGEIERLKKILDNLLPLSKRDAGDVIAARDWNTVVGALLEVARAVVDSGATRAVAPHEHPVEVGLSWLEPRLRALIERGPMDDPVAISRIGAVERGVSAVDKRLDELVSDLRDVRTSANRLEVSDLGREATITRLGRKVEGLGDARDDVTQVRETLDAVRADLTSVLRFAAGLGSVTPVELLEGLSAVEDLRARLTTPSGAVLDAAEFERRLTELSTTLVTEEELNEALDGVRTRIPDDVLTSLLEAARSTALTQTQDVVDALGEQLNERITARMGEVAEVATSAAREEAARVADALRGALREELTSVLGALVSEGDEAVRAELRQAVAEAVAAAQSLVDERVASLREDLPGLVGEEIGRRQPEIVAAVQSAIAPALAKFGTRVGAVEAETASLRDQVVSTATGLAELRQKTATDLDRLSSDLRKQFDKDLGNAVADLKAGQESLDERIRGEMSVERRRVDENFEELRRQIEEIRRKIGMKDTDKPDPVRDSTGTPPVKTGGRAAEPATGPAAERAAEPASERATHRRAEPAEEPAAGPGSESAVEPAEELAAEPAAKPGTESAAEPAAKPEAEPAKPGAEAAAEPGEPAAETVHPPTKRAKAKSKHKTKPKNPPDSDG